MKKIIQIGVFLLIISCGTVQKPAKLNQQTNYFPAKENKVVNVLHSINVDADTLKTLLVVPNSEYFVEMGKNMNFFDEVLSYEEFQNAIIKAGLADEVGGIYDNIGLNRASKKFKPFVILETTRKQKTEGGWYAGFKLYDPKKAEVIFQNEIKLNLMWDGWTDQGTMFPLYNNLLDYLRKQK